MKHEYSWMLRFTHRDPKAVDDELWFNSEDEAREALAEHECNDTSAELYELIELIEVDWTYRCDTLLDCVTFEGWGE